MSHFFSVEAIVTVRMELLAASSRDAIDQAHVLLPQCRLRPPARRRWFEALLGANEGGNGKVGEVVSAEVRAVTYAAGE